MKLIAKKPCSFGGKQFFIGDEVPAKLVLNPAQQEAWGVLTMEKAPDAPVVQKAEPDAARKAPAKKSGKKPVEEAGEQ